MRRSPLFRKPSRLFRSVAILALVILVPLFLEPLAHASTYVGYGSANQGSAVCPSNCEGDGNNGAIGIGETIQAPFAGSLVAVGILTGQITPNQVVVLTFPAGTTPTSSNYGCGSAGTCTIITGGQTFTVQDVEGLSGLGASGFFTINLANPVTVANGQWVSIVYMFTGGSGNNYVMAVGAGGQAGATLDTQFTFGSTNPGIGTTASSQGGPIAGIVGGSFNPTGTSGGTVTVTQCYGNCGSPAITLANTNSTHSINFNQTLTLLYEFQSNLNGVIQNVTVSLGRVYFGNLFLGVYLIPSCNLGLTPFSAACPGLLQQSQSQLGLKGKNSMTITNLAVANGQWVGITVTATLAGLDLNDTNTNVALFQTNEGRNPPAIQAASLLSGTSKVGLWAWIRGNVVTGGPPTTPGGSCQSFATIDCWVPALINGFCSNATPQCQTSSALFWILIFSILFEVALAYSFNKVTPNLRIPFGEMFLFIFLAWTFIMTGLSLIFVWVPVLFFMVVSIIFSKHTGRYF